MANHKSKQAGLSLVELMIVVAIMGVIAALAMPFYDSFKRNSMMAEAKTNLPILAALQKAWYLEHESYLNLVPDGPDPNRRYGRQEQGNLLLCELSGNNLEFGFQLAPCEHGSTTAAQPKYGYGFIIKPNDEGFIAWARSGDGMWNSVCPNSPMHGWGINELNQLIESKDFDANDGDTDSVMRKCQ